MQKVPIQIAVSFTKAVQFVDRSLTMPRMPGYCAAPPLYILVGRVTL
ncbi:hypothetical protein SAMN05216237_1849 [Pseudomonas yamanorum]|nr:hypothetical protein SAMN05216237_1849 [Pseudomonas yamanorum]